jgi:SAM-dependent methyltransferase
VKRFHAAALVLGLASIAIADPEKPTTRQAFEDIYRSARWGTNAKGEGNSGTGSTARSTLLYRTFLQQFLRDNEIRSVVDAGCGDWEFSNLLDWTGVDYRGYDIVEAVIAADTKKYARANIHFFAANIVETNLPPADLLISKHVLQHLSNSDVQKFLAQLPKYKHVLLINGVDRMTLSADNTDIAAGGYRELDVTRPPFNVPGVKVLSYWDGMHMHQVIYIAGKKR